MAWRKLNSAVYMYDKPAYKADRPVMALSVLKEKKNDMFLGIVREIVKREGDVAVPGFIDRSQLYVVESNDLLEWKMKKELEIKGVSKIINQHSNDKMFFIGLEDPDIYIDENDRVHVYFTIAYKLSNGEGYVTYLGHAMGRDLDHLVATRPVLSPGISKIGKVSGFKEAAISPEAFSFGRIILAESGYINEGDLEGVSTVIAAAATEMGKPWRFLRTVADPAKMKYNWIKGHMSPGPILPRDFINVNGLLVGFLNGREETKRISGLKIYGKFRVGLMLFNSEAGLVPWIAPEPLIDDADASTVTFASDFVRLNNDEGILYAHVDDSFIKAYKINAKELKNTIEAWLNKEK